MHNYPVALADWDVQQSAMMWVARRRGRRPSVMGIDATLEDAPWEDLNQLLASERSQVVMDTSAALHGQALGEVLKRSDRLILPITPSPLDMEVAVDFIAEILLHPVYLDRQMPVCAVGNRCRDQDDRSDFSDFEAFLSEVDIPLIALFGESKSYQRTLFDGQSIHETASLTRNEREAEAWSALVRWSLGEPVEPVAQPQPERLGKIQAPTRTLRVGGAPRPRTPAEARPAAGRPNVARADSERRDPIRPPATGAAPRTQAPAGRPGDTPKAETPRTTPSERGALDRVRHREGESSQTKAPEAKTADPKPAQRPPAESSAENVDTGGSERAAAAEPDKRGPGRPRGSRSKPASEPEPGASAEPPKRGPGRPKGSKNKTSPEAAGAGGTSAAAKRGPGRPRESKSAAATKTGSARSAAASKSKR